MKTHIMYISTIHTLCKNVVLSRLFLLLFLLLFFMAPHSHAQSNTVTPEHLRIDAILKDDNNVPYEGFFTVKVRLFPGNDLDASALYEETFTELYVANGFLSVILGKTNPLEPEIFNDNSSIEYEVSIGNDAGYIGTLAVPYAYKANYAATANAVLWDNISGVPDYIENSNVITSTTIADGSITNEDISPTAQISFSKLDIDVTDISGLGFITQNATLSSSQVQTIVEGMGFLTSVSSRNIVADAAIPFSKLNISREDIEGLGISTELTDRSLDTQATRLGYIKSITSANIAEGETIPFTKLSITKEEIEGLGFTANVINDGTISTVKLSDLAITEDKLAGDSVTSEKIQNGSITGDDIQTGAISGSKLLNATITNSKIANGSVKNEKLSSKTITHSKIADLTIINSLIATSTITFDRLNISKSDIVNQLQIPTADTHLSEAAVVAFVSANGYITTVTNTDITGTIDFSKITVSSNEIAFSKLNIPDNTIDWAKIDQNTIDLDGIKLNSTDIADNSITSAKITDASIIAADIVDGTITFDKLDISKANLVNSLNIPTADTTLTESEVDTFVSNNGFLTTLTNSDITESIHFSNLNISKADLVNTLNIPTADTTLTESEVDTFVSNNGYLTTVGAADIADGSITFAKLTISKDDLVTHLNIPTADTNTQLSETEVDNLVSNNGYLTTVTESDIADSTVTFAKLNITKSDLVIELNIPTADTNTQLSETEVDNLVSNNGYLTAVTNADVSGNIDFSKIDISAGEIAFSKLTIADSDIDWAKIDPDSVDLSAYELGGDNLVTGSVDSNIILDSSIQSVDLDDGIIQASHVAIDVLTANHIANNAITATELADNSVDSDAVLNNAITNAKLADNAVNTDELKNLSITNEKIIDTQITYEKLNLASNIIPQSKVDGLNADILAIVSSFNSQDASLSAARVQRNNFETTINGLVSIVNSLETELDRVDIGPTTLTYTGTVAAAIFSGNGSGLTNISADLLKANTVDPASIQTGAVTFSKLTLNDNDIPVSKVNALPETLSTFTTSINALEADISPLKVDLSNAQTTINHLVTDFSLLNINTDRDIISFTGAINATAFIGSAELLTNFPANSIGSSQISALSVNTSELANDAVTNDQLADDSIASENIQADSVDTDEIVNGAVTSAKLALNSIASENIQADAVDTDEIADGAVTSAKLRLNSIASENIQADAVDTDEIADGAVTSAKLRLNSIASENIQADAVDTDEITDGAVTSAKLALNSIASENIQADAVDTDEITDRAVTSAKLALNSIASENIQADAVDTDEITDRAVTSAKLALNSIASENIQADAVDTDEITDRAVTSAKLALNSIASENIQADAVDTDKIADGAVTSAKLALNSIASENIQADAVDTNEIADGAVTNAKIANGTISLNKLGFAISTDTSVLISKTIDWSTNLKYALTLAGDTTLSFTAPSSAVSLSLIITQDSSGERTLTWPAAVKWSGGIEPELSTGANSVDIITLLYDGISYYGFAAYGFE